ncbi:hypothetical protein [Promicromonospora iranensis]|uniref:Methyltransferase family protein n=1 Tax=Promicromonospora iranensis TaxID=1105144 RepID=A0ABU2CIW6_9MICO|nr:hypothetical protein [Promicromonospora iranensis]MDR7381269.1 hypothetical protein [Promicromonospora iranensis]
MDFSKAERDAALEDIAVDLHLDTPAVDAHHTIATQMWGHIKALEYTTGRLLAVGRDAEILAGSPPGAPRTLDGLTTDSDSPLPKDIADQILLSGNLPEATQWPHHDLNLEPVDASTVEAAGFDTADVVIANLPYADTRALTRDRQIDIAMAHHGLIRQALTWLRPGGLLVALAHRQLLDGTDAQPRRSIAKHADLIAASRLPASALRQAPLLDSPVDLLMLRRREPGHPPSGLPFIRRTPVRVHAHPDMLINECYAVAPWAVLGDIVPDPVQPGMTTATPFGGAFGVDLGDVLHDQTTIAIDFKLHAQVRPTPRPEPLPSPADQSRGPAPDTGGPAL